MTQLIREREEIAESLKTLQRKLKEARIAEAQKIGFLIFDCGFIIELRMIPYLVVIQIYNNLFLGILWNIIR